MFAVACTFASSKVIPRPGCSFHTPARCTIAEVPWAPISTPSRTARSPGVTRHRSRTSGVDPPLRPRAHEEAGQVTVPDQRPADVPAEETGASRDEDFVVLHEGAIHCRGTPVLTP